MNNNASDQSIFEVSSPFADLSARSIIGIVAAGIAASIVTLIVGYLLDNYIIGPALCRGASNGACLSSDVISFHISTIIGSLAALILLINSAIYRPLLVVISATISTWYIHTLLLPLSWYWTLLILIVVNTVAYLTFSWLLRVYNLLIALGLTIVVTAALLLVSKL